MAQIDLWRIQAALFLEQTLTKNKSAPLGKNDNAVDACIRTLANQPQRPEGKPPYLGMFGQTGIEGRNLAKTKLVELILKLTGGAALKDLAVDTLIRTFNNLPQRPEGKAAYASLFPASSMQLLNVNQLLSICPDASKSRLTTLMPHLNRTMVEFQIMTPLRQAHFLAQVAHESDRFNALEEYASGSDYEWREDLGNVQAGDGVKFKGRSLIQTTGRNNYKACGQALGVDLITYPKRLCDPDLACRSAGWFWDKSELNPDADRDDLKTITRVINGGYNGLDDRKHILKAAKKVLGI